jgi:DNA replication protein DnaC
MACEKCGGTGWRVIERDGVSAAEACGCATVEEPRDLEGASRIPPLYRNASTENFVLPPEPGARQALGAVMAKVSAYAKEFPFGLKKPGLLFMGSTGTGKTHLAVAVLRRLMARGFEGVYYDYADLLGRVRAGYDLNAAAEDREAYQNCLDVPVLLLDDLGAHRSMEWIEDAITTILTHRCNHQKALIATTNLPDPDAGDDVVRRIPGTPSPEYRTTLGERIGARSRSRLFEMCEVVRMPEVGDYRVKRR